MTRRPPAGRRPTHPPRAVRAPIAGAAIALAASGLALALAGCTPAAPSASPSTAKPTSTATSTPAAVAPKLVPGGTADENLPFFDSVNKATLAAKPDAKGRDFIDALVAAGFAKADMQLTVDTTTIGLKANSIQFSVKLGESCLIGQNGADAGGYNSMATPVLPTGACLIGQTRAIDW